MQWAINSTTLKIEAEDSSNALVPIYRSTCVSLHKTVLVIAVLSF